MLPFIVVGSLAAVAGKKLYDKYNDKNTKSTSIVKIKLDTKLKNEIQFSCTLLSAGAHCDGRFHEDEKKLCLGMLEKYKEEFEVTEESINFFKEMEMVFESLPDFTHLKKYYKSLPNPIDNKKAYTNLILDTIRTEGGVNHYEEAFYLKCLHLFEDIGDTNIYIYENSGVTSKKETLDTFIKNNYFIIVDDGFLNSNFNDTQNHDFIHGELLIKNPMNHLELVSLKAIESHQFAVSKDAELIKIAREAGAKKIEIEIVSKSNFSTSEERDLQMRVTAKPIAVAGSFNYASAASDVLNSDESKKIVFEFEGNKPSLIAGIIQDIYRFSAKNVLKNSVYIKNDATLVQFVEGCFSRNTIKSFTAEFEYTEIANALKSAELALKIKAPAYGGVNANFSEKTSSDKLNHRKVRYTVTFE